MKERKSRQIGREGNGESANRRPQWAHARRSGAVTLLQREGGNGLPLHSSLAREPFLALARRR